MIKKKKNYGNNNKTTTTTKKLEEKVDNRQKCQRNPLIEEVSFIDCGGARATDNGNAATDAKILLVAPEGPITKESRENHERISKESLA